MFSMGHLSFSGTEYEQHRTQDSQCLIAWGLKILKRWHQAPSKDLAYENEQASGLGILKP
jgi:hypothetical protein